MKKRNCRRTPAEISQHELAVSIRKKTDAQLCDLLYQLENNIEARDVSRFLEKLDELAGTGNGIGHSTIAKLKEFAKEEGYIGG